MTTKDEINLEYSSLFKFHKLHEKWLINGNYRLNSLMNLLDVLYMEEILMGEI